MKKIKRMCDCDHLGQCIFHKPDTKRTDKEGNPLWRPLRDDEPAWGNPEPGDLVSTTGNGQTRIEGRAVDEARSVAYAKTKEGCHCRAQGSAFWRLRYPAREPEKPS